MPRSAHLGMSLEVINLSAHLFVAVQKFLPTPQWKCSSRGANQLLRISFIASPVYCFGSARAI